MTGSEPDQAMQIQGYLDRARAEYAVTRAALAEALRQQPPGLLEHLVAHTDEMGVDHAMKTLRDDPASFRLTSSDNLPFAQLTLLLPKLADLNWEIGGLTGERENLAGRMTIADGRIFNVDGREATVDLASGTLRFLDQTSEPLNLEAVEPRAIDKQPSRRRRRDRDR